MMTPSRIGTLLLAALTVATACVSPAQPPSTARSSGRPNILFVLTDDLDTEALAHLPRLGGLLSDRGTSFSNAFVSLSLCCPSRSSMLRGQYAHNTEIFGNQPPQGGFEKFHASGREQSTVATWLQAAGYRTVLLGKYLNGYPERGARTYVPPGWDEWYSPAGGTPYGEFRYELNENGRLVSYGERPDDYMTDVLARKATDFVKRAAAQPFFMWLATYAPHMPATPAPRHAEAFPGVRAPRPPSFNEEDVSDKPPWRRQQPPLGQRDIERLDGLYRRRLQTMLAVEDLVQSLITALEETGQLDRTYLFFFSDNGFHLGQHRLEAGKNTGFEEDLRVPLIVRGPAVAAGRILPHLVVNIDLAPTFAELGGASAPDFVDGRSLVPLLGATPPSPDQWRQAFLLEHRDVDQAAAAPPAGEDGLALAGVLEPPDAFDASQLAQPRVAPVFVGVRTKDHTYIEYATGERELYDLAADPYQLTNIAARADRGLLGRLATWLDSLRRCSGKSCREAEDRAR